MCLPASTIRINTMFQVGFGAKHIADSKRSFSIDCLSPLLDLSNATTQKWWAAEIIVLLSGTLQKAQAES